MNQPRLLVFEIRTIAALGRPLPDGSYTVPVRASDDGDCLSTISHKGLAGTSGGFVIVCLQTLENTLVVDEVGQVCASVLSDVAKARAAATDRISQSSSPSAIAYVTLLRYRTEIGDVLRKAFPILQRELRRAGVDVCVDESGLVVGFSDTAAVNGLEQIPVNLIGRLDFLSERDGNLISRSALATKSVLVVGLGSIGSVLASDLARCGVGKFIIADGQRLEWGNIVRHAAGASDVGRLKTKIVSDLILDRQPRAEVLQISSHLEPGSRAAYDQAAASADVIVCATDNRISRLMCNRLSVKYLKPSVFGGLSRGAYSGMVFRFRPQDTMCYHCLVTEFPDVAADSEMNESDYGAGPDGHLALDIAPITNLMAKLVILELGREGGTTASGLSADLSAPWYLWINRRDREYADLDPLGSPEKGPQILQWKPIRMERVGTCPHCGERSSSGAEVASITSESPGQRDAG